MHKTISIFLIAAILSTTLFSIKPFVKEVHAWDWVAAAVIVWAADQSSKWSKKVNKKKGHTTTTYEPKPGYGEDDRYWKFNDIVDHFEDYHGEYTFINDSPPSEAYASLPNDPVGGANNISVTARISAQSASVPAQSFPWDSQYSSIRKGDIVFTRSNTTASKALQYVSSWVHTAIIVSADRHDPESLESFADKGGPDRDGGVGLFNPKWDWAPGYSWSVKRIKSSSMSTSQVSSAVDKAVSDYVWKMDYFPKYFSSHRWRQDFIAEWADKNNNSSMYCSKLTWKTFDNKGLDLDSERTKATMDNNFYHGYTDYGAENDFAWIGVSGDDIYYSKHLDSDIFSYGKENLSNAIPEWVF